MAPGRPPLISKEAGSRLARLARRRYEITARGIDRIEGGSEFETRERYGDLKVNATGANVIPHRDQWPRAFASLFARGV
jgi:hypothetical protein